MSTQPFAHTLFLVVSTAALVFNLGCTTPKSQQGYCLLNSECTSGVCDPVARRCRPEIAPNYLTDSELQRRLDMQVVDAAIIDAQLPDMNRVDAAALAKDGSMVERDANTADAQMSPTDALTSDALTTDALTSDALTSDALTSDAISPDMGMGPDACINPDTNVCP